MTINRSFNLNASESTSDTDICSGEVVTLVDTYDISASVSTGPIEGSADGFGAAVNADATAIGEDTFASVSAYGSVNAGPIASSATISLVTEASATAAGQSYASATGSIQLIGGAERSFSLSYDSSIVDQEAEATTSSSSSVDYLYALNIDGPNFGLQSPNPAPTAGVLEGEEAAGFIPPDTVHYDPCGCSSDGGIAFDGNVALYDVNFEALAEDSSIAVDLFALSVEDQMSNVTLGGTLLIG